MKLPENVRRMLRSRADYLKDSLIPGDRKGMEAARINWISYIDHVAELELELRELEEFLNLNSTGDLSNLKL